MSKFPVQPLHKDYMVLRTAGLASVNSAKFGLVRRNKDGTPRSHQGIDLAIATGYRCYAVDNGKIVSVTKTDSTTGYGNTITIKLDNGLFAFYAHLSRIDVATGQAVKAGDVIGLTGCSGNARGMSTIAKGSHLHFEVRTEQSPGLGLGGRLDPLAYVTLT